MHPAKRTLSTEPFRKCLFCFEYPFSTWLLKVISLCIAIPRKSILLFVVLTTWSSSLVYHYLQNYKYQFLQVRFFIWSHFWYSKYLAERGPSLNPLPLPMKPPGLQVFYLYKKIFLLQTEVLLSQVLHDQFRLWFWSLRKPFLQSSNRLFHDSNTVITL